MYTAGKNVAKNQTDAAEQRVKMGGWSEWMPVGRLYGGVQWAQQTEGYM